MSEAYKRIFKFGSTTNTAGETITEPIDAVTGYLMSADDKHKVRMDVVVNVKTLTGTSPTITVSVQESFDGSNFMETAKTAALSATGAYTLCSETVPSAAVTKASGAFPMLGKGYTKQFVTTAGGTVGAVSIDFYLIFYSGN